MFSFHLKPIHLFLSKTETSPPFQSLHFHGSPAFGISDFSTTDKKNTWTIRTVALLAVNGLLEEEQPTALTGQFRIK
jgi:hypothetical protein